MIDRRCRRRRAASGLTLLELLVALAIFSIVGSAIYSTFTTTLAGRDRALQRAQAYAIARGVLDRIEADVRGNADVGIKGSLLPRFVAPGSGRGFGAASSLRDADFLLELTTLSARGVTAPEGYLADEELAAKIVDHGDQAHVVWRTENGPDGPQLVRYEVRPPRNEAIDFKLAPRQVVADNVVVRLDFYDQDQWGEIWDSASPGTQHDRTPSLVRTTVELETDDEEPIVLVSAVMPALTIDKRRKLPPPRPSRDGKSDKNSDGDKKN